MTRPRYPSDAKAPTYTRAYKDRHPGAVQVQRALAKARKLGLRSDLTLAQWEQIVDEHEHRCAYCLTHESDAPYVSIQGFGLGIDHIIPLSQGGPTTRANVVPCCYVCNQAKRHGDFTPSVTSRLWPFDRTLENVKEALK